MNELNLVTDKMTVIQSKHVKTDYLSTDICLNELLETLLLLYDEITLDAHQRLIPFRRYYSDGRFSQSAHNVAHYLAFRQHDLRSLQSQLASVGLSSLGRAEADVMSNLEAVIELLCRSIPTEQPFCITAKADHSGHDILATNSQNLFGNPHTEHNSHIMVTMDASVACSAPHIRAMLSHGMTCARINCAHDEPAIWEKIVNTIREVEIETQKRCKIMFDLAGHKIRTGKIQEGPEVLRLKTRKGELGKVTQPARLILCHEASISEEVISASDEPLPKLTAPDDLLAMLEPGQVLHLTDIRHKRRQLFVEKMIASGQWLLKSEKSIYLGSNMTVSLESDGNTSNATFCLGKVAPIAQAIRVIKDDLILLSDQASFSKPASYDENGHLDQPAILTCTLAGIAERLEVGQAVWIDDGKIGTMVEKVGSDGAWLRVTHAKNKGDLIKPDKGINFPDTHLDLPALSCKDLSDLSFISHYADLIGFSFVESAADIEELIEHLHQNAAGHLPIIAKIETNRAVKNLPDIILGTIGKHKLGIMIARGDLSVELGSARLTEIQEEIMWLCEAAHTPVIWATQVLETIAKKGGRSRAEFTDAGMAARAECVMLNKGPYILDALDALVQVVMLMNEHQHKKFSRLRALHW
ncbi:pyruvate kinase [Methylophaga lonarensis]|uniref:pyruvate kinase n=1 Tax=Methylophaga lonarensis TaxID=999151 RepID=UPI003D26A3CA